MRSGAFCIKLCVLICRGCCCSQADRDEARNQHAAAVTELEALSQQLAAASTAKSQAEAAAEELQAEHDALTAQQAALQAQVRVTGVHMFKECTCCCQEHSRALHCKKGPSTGNTSVTADMFGCCCSVWCRSVLIAGCARVLLLLLLSQLKELQEASEAAAAKAEELTAALEASQEALTEARALTSQQASRLSHLESEFEALQV